MSTHNEARMVRKRATASGLRMTQRGHVFELREGDGGDLLAVGSLRVIDGYVKERFVAKRPGPARAAEPVAWRQPITDYCLALAAAGQSTSTIRSRRQALARLGRELRCAPAEVTGEQLVAWFGRQQHWKPETRRNNRSAVRSFFRWAYRTGRAPDYLADDLPSVRIPGSVARPVSDEAWRLALDGVAPRVELMMRLAAESGLRRAEVAQVHTRDVVEGHGGPQLVVHGKGGKTRVLPISDSLAAAVRAGAAGHTSGMSSTGWLFPTGSGGHLTPEHVGALVAALLPPGYTMHKLRHRFATRAYRGSRNLRAVQMLLGHASVATTQRYTAVDEDEIRAAMMAAIGD